MDDTTKSPPPARGKTRSPVKEISKQQIAAPIRLKVVVRRLPANLPESVFWQSVQSWVSEETSSWKIFYEGKLRKKLNKEHIPSRAYILFKNEEYLAAFSREYDGHLFRDKQGNESQAVVEFAPNQKTPPEKKKLDSRHGTIHQDEDYLSFLSSLQNPPAKPAEVDFDALLASTLPAEEPKTTPLLAALREQKHSAQEKKILAAEAKSQSRKGGAAAAPTQKQDAAELAPSAGKKSKKGKTPQPVAAAPSAPVVVNPSKSGRNRSAASQASSRDPSSASTSIAPAPAGKGPAMPADSESAQRRNRPMLGLQSRHLKAALSGAGVQLASPTAASSSAAPLVQPSPDPTAAAAAAPPRGPRGRGGGEKRPNEDNNAARGSGGRGGKDKARTRHPPASQAPAPALAARATDATPRILTRQDPPSVFNVTDPPLRGVPPDVGGGRGRGGRRGRGQG